MEIKVLRSRDRKTCLTDNRALMAGDSQFSATRTSQIRGAKD